MSSRGGLKLAHALDAFGIDVAAARPRHRRLDRRLHRRAAPARRARGSWRSTSATVSSTGACATIRASSCIEHVNARASDAPLTCPAASTSSRSTSRSSRCATFCPSVPAPAAPEGRRRRAGEAAVRGRPRARCARASSAIRRCTRASSPRYRAAGAEVGLTPRGDRRRRRSPARRATSSSCSTSVDHDAR